MTSSDRSGQFLNLSEAGSRKFLGQGLSNSGAPNPVVAKPDGRTIPRKQLNLLTLMDFGVCPEMKFYYRRQNPSAGRGSPQSSQRTDVMLVVTLPNETGPAEEFTIRMTETRIELKTGLYWMRIPIKQKIDPQHYNASYDCIGKQLSLYLRFKQD